MINIKVLTIKQPFASLISENRKKVEIRSWKTKFRGELYIHAGLGIDKENIKKYEHVIPKDEQPFGKIISKCNLIDCILIDKEYIDSYNKENKDSLYTISYDYIGYYGFVLDNIVKLKDPIETKGKLSFWNYENK